METEVALNLLRARLNDIEALKQLTRHDEAFQKWRRDTRVTIENIFGKDSSQKNEFYGIRFRLPGRRVPADPEERSEYEAGLTTAKAVIRSMITELKLRDQFFEPTYLADANANNPLLLLRNIFSRFHLFASQIQKRREGRSTIAFNDEYDVQDALHAILMLHFSDVRPEEPTPSLAGKYSRMDFLLKLEGIVVEAKMPRSTSHAKQIGDELLIDKERYKKRPDCRFLMCLVYDPNRFIQNPVSFQELNAIEDRFQFEAIVTPTGL